MNKWTQQVISMMTAAALLIPSGWYASDVNADAQASPNIETVYHESFETGVGKAVQSGSASLTYVADKAFEGNDDGGALYVSNRANNWDAVDFKYADIGLKNGETYTVTASVYVDADVIVPSGAQAFLQTVNSYGWLDGKDFTAGSAAVLSKEFTVNTGTDSALRIQSNDEGKAVPFYLGDVRITKKVTRRR